MLFFSDTFLFAFLPITIFIYYFFGKFSNRKYQMTVLLVASIAFYGFWSVRHLPLLLGVSLYAYFVIVYIERQSVAGKKPGYAPLVAGIIGCIGALMVFKYANFWLKSFYDLTGAESLSGLAARSKSIVLPLGISFFTVQGLGAIIDKWREARQGRVKETTTALDFVTFKIFFPQLIAGPITRIGEMFPQFKSLPKKPDYEKIAVGLTIFSVGLAKKILIADNVASIVNPVFDSAIAPSGPDAAIAALAYTLQLYFDFSGYSDMAIGIGALFGFTIPNNFLSPYRSASFTEFWRRNHITLSFWFRDYLYIPLGGSKCGIFRRNFNLIVVMAVAGLWHGASWTFVLWGLYQALFILLHRAWIKIKKQYNLPTPGKYFPVALNFILLTIGWVLFRAASFEKAATIYAAAGTNWNAGFQLLAGISNVSWVAFSAGFILILFFPNIYEMNVKPSLKWAAATGILFAASIAGILVYSPFIYFQF